mgnify:FL=1
MINFIKKKYYRLLGSANALKIFYLYHKLFGEKYLGNLNFDFSQKKNRIEIIQKLISLKSYKSYLEIGTFQNDVFDNIFCDKKIGVDPFSGGNTRMTSDEFFKKNKDKFDLIFIDGLHTYRQVKKDILNSVDSLNDKGVILIHDCLPQNYFANATPRSVYKWNGDVWKAFIEMRTKSNLDAYCCFADEGIGVILKRNNKNLLNLEIKDFSKIKFNYFFNNYKKLMNLKEFDEILNKI